MNLYYTHPSCDVKHRSVDTATRCNPDTIPVKHLNGELRSLDEDEWNEHLAVTHELQQRRVGSIE